MTTAARPSTARKVTRKSQEAAQAAMDAGDIWFKVDGDVYHVAPMDLTGLDERRIRQVVGLPFSHLADQFGTAPGIDTLAGMMWISSIQAGGPATEAAYETFLGSVTYGTEIDLLDGKPDEAVESPEA